MKTLVTYFSQTGNTEKVAQAIYESLSRSCETDIRRLEDTGADELSRYQLVFIGSPCNAGDLSGAVKNFLKTLPEQPAYEVAGFITHAGAAYSRAEYEGSFKTFRSLCSEKGIDVTGVFDCQGFLNPAIHDFVKKSKNLSDMEWKERVARMEGHPDKDDLTKARSFAEEMVEKVLRNKED